MSVHPISYNSHFDDYDTQSRGYKIVTEEEFYKSSIRSSRKSTERQEGIEDALIDPTYAVSPMKPLRYFLDLGTLIGVFPAIHTNNHIMFYFECCSGQTVWAVLFTVVWLAWGIAMAGYCATNDSDVTITNNTGITSIFEVKSLSKSYQLTATDQIVIVSVPFFQLLAWMSALILGWTSIDETSNLCVNFCKRGFRIESHPENRVILEFIINYFIFGIGQTICNAHISMVYCSNAQKQILFVVLITLWTLPIYVILVYNGYLFCQFTYTLTDYFKKLRLDIEDKSLKIGSHGNILYAEAIKRGLPRRYERLHDNINSLDVSYGSILLYEYLLYHILMVAGIYMSVSSIMTGIKASTFPWWFFGYSFLAFHHLLRLFQLSNAGHILKDEVNFALGMLSQFAYIHSDMTMLCLAIARKPTSALITLKGWAALNRGLVGKTLAFVLISMLLITNYKMRDQ